MPARALTFGVSGCDGAMAAMLARVRQHSHCVPHAIHDEDAAAAASFAAANGLRVCASFDALLQSGIDFVVLAGKPCDRLAQVEAAAAQGAHCLLMAPMALDSATASAMLRACDANGVKLGVAVEEQGDPAMEQLRRMVADDWLGAPVLVQAIAADDGLLRNPPRDGHWLRDQQHAHGSALAHFATAPLHLAIWMCERAPLAASAMGTEGLLSLPHENATATVALRGGALCAFSSSHSTSGQSFSLHGTDGILRVEPDRIWLKGRKAFRGDSFTYPQPFTELALPRRHASDPLAAHFELCGRFARWIDDLDDFPCPGEQAALDMRAIDAMLRSLRTGRVENVDS